MSDDHTIDVGPVHVHTDDGACPPSCPHPDHRLSDEQVRWHADPDYRHRNARLSLTAEQYQREQDALAREVLESRAEIERLREVRCGWHDIGMVQNDIGWTCPACPNPNNEKARRG